MIKRLLIVISILTIMAVSASAAGDRDFGLGIILGEPTGLSGKLWTGGNSAIDGAMAWSLDENASLHLHADYLVHSFSSERVEKGRLPFYYGIGGRIKFAEHDNDDFIGLRIPLGAAYIFESNQVDLFFEIVPILDLIPDTDFDLNAAVGARYFF